MELGGGLICRIGFWIGVWGRSWYIVGGGLFGCKSEGFGGSSHSCISARFRYCVIYRNFSVKKLISRRCTCVNLSR